MVILQVICTMPGLFCESDGEVFFSNTNDNGRLYAMNIDGSNIHKLSNDTAMYINADKNYVYYVRNNNQKITSQTFFSYDRNSLCRIKKKWPRLHRAGS